MTRPEARSASRILRFTLGERLAHWNHALTFIALFITGVALIFPWALGMPGRETLLLFGKVHRVAAILFTAVTIPLLCLLSRQQAREWIQATLHFDRDDFHFLALFWRDFFGLKVKLPDQGKFNAGEKVNSLLQLIGWPVMVVSGGLLFFRDSLPQALGQWVLPIHSFGALLLGAAVIGHIYLATLHPHSRPGLSGMFSGWVPARWARAHYRKYYGSTGADAD